jgi:asparagine synthase (glutamine-hydrolysing)
MADVPVGTMCSGGVDSSLVTALVREEHSELLALHASLDGAFDERRWAQRVARAVGVQLETVCFTPSSWREGLVPAVAHCEYPLSSPSPVLLAGIAKAAKEAGVKVLLTGEGADELFSGYEYHHRRLLNDFLPRRLKLRRVFHRVHPDRLQVLAGEALRELRDPWVKAKTTVPEVKEAARFERDAIERAERAYGHHSGARATLESRLLAELPCRPLPYLLNRMDKNVMQGSVEARVPFLDPGLVALVLNLPLEARVTPLPKGVLRDVARRCLPRDVAERPKHPFVGGIQVGRRGAAMDPGRLIEERACPEFLAAGRLREVLEIPVRDWKALLAEARSGHRLRLWTGEIWCRVIVDHEPLDDVQASLWGDLP